MKIQQLCFCVLGAICVSAPPGVFAAEDFDEVVVTATRQGQNLREYPGSVSVIGPDKVALVGSTHHNEILNRAAGTMIQRNSGQESLTAIRSPVLTGPGSCGAFLFLEDSVPIRPVGFCNVNELFEVNTEQAGAIEVLRGPAGVVYGSSAMHGAINVLRPAPADLPRHSIGVEAGPDSYYRGRLGFSRSGAMDFSANAIVTDDGGWREDARLREQKLNVALAGERHDATFGLRLSATNLNQETAGFIQGRDSYRDRAIARSNFNPEAYRDAHSVRLNGHYERALGGGMQLDIRPYVRSSRMDFRQHFLIGKPLEENGQESLGVLTALHMNAFGNTAITAGLDLEVAESFLRQTQEGPATDGATPVANAIRPAGKQYDYDVRSMVAALYALAEHPLSDRWRLSGGVRVEHVDYDYDNRMLAGNTDENGAPCPFGGCLYSRPADRSDGFTNLTPKIGLTFLANDHLTLYTSAARGYRAPDTSELYRLQRQQSIADLDSERLDSLEIGMRGAIGGALNYALAAFDMRKENVIFRDANAFNVSDGRTKHRGIEYELSWTALDTLVLAAAGTYAKHTYDFDRAIEGGETIVSGRDVDTAPRHVHTARASWRFMPDAIAELELQSVGRYWLDAANAHEYEGHTLLNLRVGWNLTPSWGIMARLNNLTDRVYADRADFAFGNYRYFPGRGRALFVEVHYRAE